MICPPGTPSKSKNRTERGYRYDRRARAQKRKVVNSGQCKDLAKKKKKNIYICGLGIFGIKERCRIQDIDQKVKIVFRSMVFNVQQWIGRITHTHTHTHSHLNLTLAHKAKHTAS